MQRPDVHTVLVGLVGLVVLVVLVVLVGLVALVALVQWPEQHGLVLWVRQVRLVDWLVQWPEQRGLVWQVRLVQLSVWPAYHAVLGQCSVWTAEQAVLVGLVRLPQTVGAQTSHHTRAVTHRHPNSSR